MPSSEESSRRGDLGTDELNTAFMLGAQVGSKVGKQDAWVVGLLVASLMWNAFLSFLLLQSDLPCNGCFESLKWRVDELRAIHKTDEGAYDEQRPSDRLDEERD